jgi:hypothetical protein
MFCIVGAMPNTALGASMALINFLRYQTPAKILNLNLNSARSFEKRWDATGLSAVSK